MPKKKTAEQAPAEETPLVSAAKTIGTAAGKIAAAVGVKPEAATGPAPVKRGKPQKRNKQRLPRKLKKQMKKQAAKSAPAAKKS